MFSINDIFKILFILNYFEFKDKIFLRFVLLKVFIGYLGRYRVSKFVKESFCWIGIDNDVR